VTDGRAPVDNNVIKRDIRPFCTGRSSWLFSDTVAGAKASAMVYSLMLTELPQRAPDADIGDLLPFNFERHESLAQGPSG
jgi:hypothetical protein